ncbi:hypothetical protein [Micromonospora sp. NPDC049033]|uniref:hypothetical protein n=1 Tax=Micromonospora sp. NPDC049033 TaxID=3155149 RepID=UPI00340035EC
MSLRLVAEHEAAHAVVAAYYGVHVEQVEATAGRGRTRCGPAASPRHDAAIDAAGDVWDREFTTQPYRDAACSDLLRLERGVGAAGVWQARRDARKALTIHQTAVRRMADQLERHGRLTVVRGQLVPG